MHARGGAVLSLRWAEELICCWVCCADSIMACSRALLCLSSGAGRRLNTLTSYYSGSFEIFGTVRAS
eukprot:5416958-Prymnesium_polylepis.1